MVILRIFGPTSTTSPKGKVMLSLTTPQQQSNLTNTSHVCRQTISMNDLQRDSRQYLNGSLPLSAKCSTCSIIFTIRRMEMIVSPHGFFACLLQSTLLPCCI